MASSIISTPGQPVIFGAEVTDCNCGERNQCLLVEPNDPVYAQLQLQPCGTVDYCNTEIGDDLICNGSFDLGSELVTNGNFTGDADDWTLGTNWAYSSNAACATASQAGQTLSQSIAITTGGYYRVEYTISTYTSGNVRVSLGGTNGATRSAAGTYTEFITAGATTTLSFERVSINFTGCIDAVSVKLLDCWTFGSGWTYEDGTACCDGSSNNLTQSNVIGGGTEAFLLTYTVSGYQAGSLLPILGGTNGTSVSADGTYQEIIFDSGGNDLVFDSTAFEGCIDNVVLNLISSCWNPDESDWMLSAEGACHVIGNTTNLTSSASGVQSGYYYHVTFTVSASSAGGVTLKMDTAAIGAQTSGNGIFERWGTADGTALILTPSTDFDGCISELEIVQYNPNYVFHLLTSDGGYVADLTPDFVLDEDIITLTNFTFNSLDNVDFGCYKICLIDGCYGDLEQAASNIIDNGDFSAGSDHWSSVDATFAGGKVTLDTGSGAYIAQNIKTTQDAGCLRIQFDYVTEGSGNIIVYVGGVNQHSEIVQGFGSVYVDIFSAPAGAEIKIEGIGLTQPLDIDNVVITIPSECRDYNQCSPCFNYKEDHHCTKLLQGWADGEALGFSFDDINGTNIFKLSMRVRAELMHSTYEQEQEDYTFSDGNSSLSFGQNTQYQSLVFSPIPTFKHSVIAKIKICDTIQLEAIDYFARKGDYIPEWNKTSNADLAPSRIDVKVKDQTTFNTNCS